ncbi:diaminopimelate decarboxylase [Ruminococcaceae bacterium YRB3002]|nr:diaminopimelate decarboxylase [Ruminococcaceae bacterium YRB3002]
MKRPFIDKEQAEEIIKTYPTPFHIYDEKGIRENARALRQAFSWNDGYKEYFAVKATPNPTILKILHEEGCGLDCSSMAELELASRCGITGENIMFSSNVTPPAEFTRCRDLGGIINLDDITHIEMCREALGGTLPEVMSCRFNPGGVFTLGDSAEGFQVMDNPGDAKYGMTESQIIEAYRTLSSYGVKRLGIHAFLASNTLSNDYYPALAKILFRLVVKIRKETGIKLSFVNLSGGVGIAYKPEDTANDIAVIGAKVREVYNEVLTPEGMDDIAIYTELGRFMLAPYGHLVKTATNEKHTYKEYIGVDACAADLMRPAMYGAYHHITVLGKEEAPCDHVYDVTGCLCENNDKFAVDRRLPAIDRGDILVIHDTGAHGYSMGYNYNGRLRSAELLLGEDGSVKLIRRRETLDDYFATLDGFWDT